MYTLYTLVFRYTVPLDHCGSTSDRLGISETGCRENSFNEWLLVLPVACTSDRTYIMKKEHLEFHRGLDVVGQLKI